MTLENLKNYYENAKIYWERLSKAEKERIEHACKNNTAYPTYEYMVALKCKDLTEEFLYYLNCLNLNKKDLKASKIQNKKDYKNLKNDLRKWRKKFKDLPN